MDPVDTPQVGLQTQTMLLRYLLMSFQYLHHPIARPQLMILPTWWLLGLPLLSVGLIEAIPCPPEILLVPFGLLPNMHRMCRTLLVSLLLCLCVAYTQYLWHLHLSRMHNLFKQHRYYIYFRHNLLRSINSIVFCLHTCCTSSLLCVDLNLLLTDRERPVRTPCYSMPWSVFSIGFLHVPFLCPICHQSEQ